MLTFLHNTNQCVYYIITCICYCFYCNCFCYCFCYCFRCQVDEALDDVIDVYVHTKQDISHVLYIVVK